jgi:predicted ATPase
MLTGGSGIGKIAVLQQLQQPGYTTMPEVASDIIREQMITNGDALSFGQLIGEPADNVLHQAARTLLCHTKKMLVSY